MCLLVCAGVDAASTAEGAAADAAATDSMQMWVLGQLTAVPKLPAASAALANRVLEFVAAVAFVDIGPKAASSKIAAVQALAPCTDDRTWSATVRSFAAARAAVLATEVLPCLAAPANGDEAGTGNKGKGTSGLAGKQSAAKNSKHAPVLLPTVRRHHAMGL